MIRVPQRCVDAGCPMAPVAEGFALHSGDLGRVKLALLLESPGPDEPIFPVKDLVDGVAEVARRRTRYPQLDERFIKTGAPVVGRAGQLLWWWVMQARGIQRTDVAVFNSLACFPGKNEKGEFAYPKGNSRKRAEATCAELWLAPLVEWNPEVVIVTLHPSALSRDVTPLPMALRAVERAKEFVKLGRRVLLCFGGKAAHHWLGYAENTTRWTGHWQEETGLTRGARVGRWAKNRGLSVEAEKGGKVTKERKARVKKLTVKSALSLLLSEFKVDVEGKFTYGGPPLSRELIEEMRGLCEKKGKKEVKGDVNNTTRPPS